MIAIDTNLLVYAHRTESPFHATASRCIKELAESRSPWAVPWPCIHEFCSVVTNPRRVKKPRSATEAVDAIEKFLAMPGITLLSVPPEVTSRWLAMVRQTPITGANVFVVQLAATALVAGVSKVCTFNAVDFQRIDGIEVIAP